MKLQQKITLILVGIALMLAIVCATTSCNVTRVVTTSSQYMQRGDTSVVIQTKTTETYDGSVKYKPTNSSSL